MQKRVAVHTLGCKLNQAETSVIRDKLLEQGFVEVSYGSEADLLVINTCTVTDTADAECRQIIRRGRKGAPNASVAVVGCYSQLKPEEVASIDGVRAVFGTTTKMMLPEVSNSLFEWDTPRIFVEDLQKHQPQFVGARTAITAERSRAYLKLQDGCDYSCTFCTIPMARGRARAMNFDRIREELDALAKQGYPEVVLTGINLGEYSDAISERGSNRNTGVKRFVDVLRLIEDYRPPFRVRISSIEPNTLSEEIIAFLAQSSVFVPHVHVPLQSGSATILQQMKRRYNPEMYARTLCNVRQQLPNAGIGVDVIVGFPGETDELFAESMSFLQTLPFTYLHVFTYSERELTPAATFPHRVAVADRKVRTAQLRQLSDERQFEFAQRQVGEVRTVISDKHDVSTNLLTGITENNVRVSFHASQNEHRLPQKVFLERAEYGMPVYGRIVA